MMQKCPACAGSGKLLIQKSSDRVAAKRAAALELRERGYTIREIMKALNYRSTSSVYELLYRKEVRVVPV